MTKSQIGEGKGIVLRLFAITYRSLHGECFFFFYSQLTLCDQCESIISEIMATKHFRKGGFSNSSSHSAGGYVDKKSRADSFSDLSSKQKYEVFLSFNGDDTRQGFTDHLYHRLADRGIKVFRDNESLSVGQNIDQLLKAIKDSEILVPIISIHYASSEWCLKELVQIFKCNKLSGRLVLPIFYKVKPSDVREQKGQFGQEFQRFKEMPSKDTELVQESEQALKEIASLTGWESNKVANGHEGELVKTVVTRIYRELMKPILDVPEYLVGVEGHVKRIMKMIDDEKSHYAKVIAIYGMGGIGKTTLAKVLYNKLSGDFDSHSFVPNIRAASLEYKGMEDLRKKVISDVLRDKSLREISLVGDGITLIGKCFKENKLLLLLDDVDDKDQLKELAVKNNCFGSESVVIITTRNKGVANASVVNLAYELNELNEYQSYELFSKHAFERDPSRRRNLGHIARGIVSMTGGLPLAIETIGSLLSQKTDGFWSDALKNLRIADKVLDKLMLSYEALSYYQKQIFLDIACLPIQHMPEYKYAYYMWDACEFNPREGIETLESLSLIKIIDHEIVMHDQLRDLGKEIVRREGYKNNGLCSRLWLEEKAIDVIEQEQGTKEIQALKLVPPLDLRDEINFESQQFNDMKNLRCLHMYNIHLTGDFKKCFPNIKWLRWRSSCDVMGINLNPKKLVILELTHIKITEDWPGWNQVKKLKVLILEYCNHLTTTPDFSAVEGLEELVLRGCSRLKKIHPSIGKFSETLQVLDVQDCSELEELPIIVWEMEELRKLHINGRTFLVQDS